MQIFTSSWFTRLPPEILKVGISRSVPRGTPAGYRRLRGLEPGPWFAHVSLSEYHRRFMAQLAGLSAIGVIEQLAAMGEGRDVALLCYEAPHDLAAWCHRGQVSAWLMDEAGIDVREYGHEAHGCGWRHPKLHTAFRQAAS